jgi:murein DD-endopeptidase MepM/ murein hydrolase activator NlpD
MKFVQIFLLSSLVFLLFACSQKPAKIVNRSKNLYSKNSELAKNKYKEKESSKEVKEVSRTNSQSEKPKSGQVEIAQGETLYSVSKKYQVTLRDLIKQNNLTPPYNLKAGTVIIIPKPNYYEVKQGDTLYGISRAHNMNISNLVEINDLKEPYSVRVGDKIRISKMEEVTKVSATEKPQSNYRLNEKPQKTEEPKSEGFIAKALDKFNHFSWPLKGQIVSRFGPKSGGLYNDGINIKAKDGADVKASEDGVVAYVGNELKGYGNLVIIKHSGGWITAYAHLKSSSTKRGQEVKKGQKIGAVGSTGNVTSPQLYFGLRKGRDAVNPENYLK